jgi:hypothetical protein
VDRLLLRGITCLTVLDVAGAALERARQRLASAAERVRWVNSDVTDPGLTLEPADIWHDRAVFHFLTQPEHRSQYVARLRSTLKPGGSLVMATFSLQGPEKCSGLPVRRYSPALLGEELGSDFLLVTGREEVHHTPSGATQLFQWSRFVFQPARP